MSAKNFILTVSSLNAVEGSSAPDALGFSTLLAASLPASGEIQLRKGDAPGARWRTERSASKLALSDLDGVLYRKGAFFVRVVQTSTGFYLRIAAPTLSPSAQLSALPKVVMQLLKGCDEAGFNEKAPTPSSSGMPGSRRTFSTGSLKPSSTLGPYNATSPLKRAVFLPLGTEGSRQDDLAMRKTSPSLIETLRSE